MGTDEPLAVYIGHDSRESVASHVAVHSIKRHTTANLKIYLLKHRELRRNGFFCRPWLIDPDTGEYRDLSDNRPFSTEFSHTRFLVPELQKFQGWALFLDADMIFTSDIKQLFKVKNDKYAVMCVPHKHKPPADCFKMDNRMQHVYRRKNWSSFVLWNCAHPSNKKLTKEKVNFLKGADLHSFSWLQDHEIGELSYTYNYISGVSPPMPVDMKGRAIKPDVIHYTEGGPWFEECQDVPFADLWRQEHENWCRTGEVNASMSPLPTMKYDLTDEVRRRG